jgi:hypothetical protein
MLTLAFSSPFARRRTPSFLRRSRPASTSVGFDGFDASSLAGLSIAILQRRQIRSTDASWLFSALKPRFGMRM